MTHEDKGHFGKKHPPEQELDKDIKNKLKGYISKGEVSCAAAHRIATELSVPPSEVGTAVDLLELSIVSCQLGLYGYRPEKKIVKPAEEVPDELEKLIRQSRVNGKIPCREVWRIASEKGLKKMDVSAACDKIGVKIKPCQLGAF